MRLLIKIRRDDLVAVMWFRRDLRIEDNTALKHAFEESKNLILLFHVNPEQFLNPASKNEAAFFKSVEVFQKELQKQGATLQLVYGSLESCFVKLKKEIPDWTDLYVNRDEQGYGLERDRVAGKLLKELGVKAHAYHDHYLHSAQEIKTNSQTHYKVFTPYYLKWIERPKPSVVQVAFDREKLITPTLFLEDNRKFEDHLHKNISITNHPVGSAAAKQTLNSFIENKLSKYEEARDFPLEDATSHLSHHIRTGEISIRTIFERVNQAPPSKGNDTFIKELAWRDFYNMVYVTYPNQKKEPVNPNFRFVNWENNEQAFNSWKEGKTGFPIVDAAMRQLKELGWMHNRLRMITASFLTKDLLIDWRWGERYFQEQLIDYDAASNIGGWQWAASTGTDGVPYFRIFNPTTQSERFDKEGLFIKKYVPELRGIDNKKIHDPSQLTAVEQDKFGVIIGKDYPKPIVDHKMRRKAAIEAYEESKAIYQQEEK